IQGKSGGSVRLGLRGSDGEIWALMIFRSRGGGNYELTRYASRGIVRGGFSRLLKRAKAELNPSSITTFSDAEVSDGALYINNGFVNDGTISPDYSYREGIKLVNKFNYRIKRFR